MREIKAVVFDVDNTLVDFYNMKKRCTTAGLEKMVERGLPATMDEAARIVEEVFRNEGWEDQLLFWHVAEIAGVKEEVSLERFALIGKTAYRKRQRMFLQAYDGIPEVLEYLKKNNVQTAILSDAPRLKVFDRLCDADLEPFFEDRVIGSEKNDRYKKPNPVAFRRVLEVLGRDNTEGILMVGDQPFRDVIGAKNNGFLAAWAKYGYIPKHGEDIEQVKTRADYILERPSDLLSIVKK